MIINENKKTVIYILIAFIFSVAIRLIWVYQFSDTEQFKFNNQFMINTNDGYYFAEGARDILAGIKEDTNDLSPFESANSILTAFIAKILPFSFESIIFYMPVFFSSLLVIPVILIGKSIGNLEAGFIAALLSSIAWSYYNRTMAGYYDTDLLNIVFPTFLLWSLIEAFKTRENKYLLFTALDIILYRWWYPQSYALEFVFFGLIALCIIYQYIKKQDFKYNLILATFMIFSMMWIDVWIRFAIVIFLYIALTLKKDLVLKYLYYLFGFSLLLLMFTGGFNPIWGSLKGYVFKDSVEVIGSDFQLHFFSVVQTIREAGKIPFEVFANRISGHTTTFIVSIIGYIYLVSKHRVMLLSLPMVGLGFLAYSGGLRFTVYAVPILALGIGFLIVKSCNPIKNKIKRYSVMTFLTTLILVPNIKHVIDYKVSTVFIKDEVNVLNKLKTIASREDYVVGWWDYGYPIRYYADVKTLSDGGKHRGSVNFPTSFVLTNPQVEASKMLRLDVEYTEETFLIDKLNEDKNQSEKIKRINNIGQMTLDYGFNDTNDFLTSLQTDIKLPEKTRDIYLYLPNRMINIYPTITFFSNIDLMTGIKRDKPFFYQTKNFKETKKAIDLGNNIKMSRQIGKLYIREKEMTINKFTKTYYDKNGKLQTEERTIDSRSNLNVIFMANYKQFLVVENRVYNSLYFQLFIFENYNRTLFEPVILTPLAKVYKLKI
ncbi:MAG: peptide transporter [Sulfurospirillum sp.]|nr:peptide transporter [Sulfurospirillum sp.]MBL0703681.1 peptide transporter [Sulfurospirillum sp.]